MKDDTAVILLAHGTRKAKASLPVHNYAKALAKKTGLRVEPCLREFIEPSFPTVVSKLNQDGIKRILILPFFLLSGGHVVKDVTKDIAQQKEANPQLTFRLASSLGEDPLLEELLAKRLFEGLSDWAVKKN